MRSAAIVTAVVLPSLFLTVVFGSFIARLFGVSSMEGGDSYFTLCCALPVVAPLSFILGVAIAAWVSRR